MTTKQIFANLSDSIQNNIISCVDANLENIADLGGKKAVGGFLIPRDIEKLKTDLCAMVCEEIALAKEVAGVR